MKADKKSFWQGQLLGLKTLPTENGAWGVLLPRPGDKQRTHKPDATEFVEVLDANQLRRGFEDGNRGFGVALGSCIGALAMIATLVATQKPLERELHWLEVIGVASIFFLWVVVPVTWAYRSARAPFREPFILSRKLRRFYLWVDKKQGWQHWNYDELVPFTQVNKLVTSAGATTAFALRLVVLDPKTREIKQSLTPAPVQRTPEQCGEIWEFIRCYMDGQPEDLPPVRSRPGIHDRAADLVRFDRQFTGAITADHRFGPGIFPKLYFGFWSVINYWQLRPMAWIQRSAPRVAMPLELAQALSQESPNPYRFLLRTPDEELALQGRLPRLRWRWAVVQLISTALWGGLFVLMSYGLSSTLWEK